MESPPGRSRSAQQASSQDPRLLRNQGREGQGGCQEEFGMGTLPGLITMERS
jgi:hypothetical protein